MSNLKMLILSGSPTSYSIKRLKEEAETKKHEVDIVDPIDFFAYISPIKSGHDRIYLKSNNDEIKKVLHKQYDVIIPRFAGGAFEFGCSIVEHFSENMGIPTTSFAGGLKIASNKLETSQRLSQHKVRTVKSIFANQPKDFKYIIDLLDGLPIVCKTLTGSMGNGVFILNDELSASTTLGAFSKLGVNLILQKFIDSGLPKSDLRIYVVDSKISGAYKRFALDSDFRSNYSISKQGEQVNLTNEEEQMAIDAAYSIALPGVCAVDIIRDSKDNNKPYVIECNGNGNLKGIEKVTGKNIAKDIIIFAEKIANNKDSQQHEIMSMSMLDFEFEVNRVLKKVSTEKRNIFITQFNKALDLLAEYEKQIK